MRVIKKPVSPLAIDKILEFNKTEREAIHKVVRLLDKAQSLIMDNWDKIDPPVEYYELMDAENILSNCLGMLIFDQICPWADG